METKSTKKITGLLALLFAFISFTSLAQTDKVDKDREERNLQNQNNLVMRKQRCDTTMKHTKYIFEGKLISSKSIGGSYISNIYEVTEVISGTLQKGTVEIISDKSNWTDDKGNQVIVKDNWQPIHSGITLNFCQDVEVGIPNSGISNTNAKTLRIVDATSFSGDKIENHRPYSMFNYFSTISQVYEYLKTNHNIKIDNSIIEKKSQVSNTTTQKKANISPEEQKQRYEKHKALLAKRRANTHPAAQRSATCIDAYISEQLDGASSNNAVEIYNPTALPISLSNYSLLIYHNASHTPTTIPLTGTISAYGTHVVAQQGASSAILAHANQTTNNLNFNGNVVTVLNKGNVHIDIIGEIGVANAAGNWTLTPSGGTNNSDIRRNYNIGQGDTTWSSAKSQWTALSYDSISNLGAHANFCSSIPDPDLIYSLANPQTTGTSPQYFEFDINVSASDNSTYLEDAAVRFNYNTAAFGTHISLNNKVTLTGLGTFANPVNYGATYQTDHNPFNAVSCELSAQYDSASFNLTNITTSPMPFMHVKIEIANCNVPVNISFYYPDSNQTSCDFTNSSLQTLSMFPTLYTHVDSLSGSSHLNNLTCSAVPMQITDFNAPINAGIGTPLLTIIGTGFGATRGNGQVKFKNADDGGATYLIGLNANDYMNWTNTQIQINLHSFADSLSTSNPDAQFIIGGGNFIVTNNAGQSATSNLNAASNPFSVYFNLGEVRDTTFTNNKERINLRSTNGSGGYILRLNPTDFPSGSPQRIAFTKAVHDWRCITEANLTIGSDTNIVGYNTNNSSGTNYVFFAPATGFVAETFKHPNSCSTGKSSLTEADMQFSTNYTFDYDTSATHSINAGQYDFYEVALHELGHFIGLEHNVVTTELMYFQELIAPTASQRIRLTNVGTSPVDGGNYSVNHSITALSTGSICWPAMVLGGCALPSGINQYLANNFFLNLYPNPSNGSTVNIDFQAPTNTEAQIIVYDMMGRTVYSNNLGNRNEIRSAYSLDVSNLSQGMYMVNLVIDKVKVCQKFIKQ